MNYPTQIMKVLGILLFLLLFFLSSVLTVRAASEITLTSMEKQEQIGSTRMIFNFSALPEFTVEHNGQRVDLLLKDVRVSAKMRQLPEDETVVKILLAQKFRDLMTSVLLRRPPKQVMTESNKSPARVVIDFYWEAESNSRPGVAFRIKDMPVRKTGKKAKALQQESPWQGRWREFFREYRTYWKLQLPQNYTLPPLPPLVTEQSSPLWQLQQYAGQQKWLSLLRASAQLNHLDEAQKDVRQLLVAEAQLRTDAPEAGLARLDALTREGTSNQVRVDYLTAYGQAVTGQPFVAQLSLQELLPQLNDSDLLAPQIYLLAAEVGLSTNQYQPALTYLQKPELDWPVALDSIIALRQADALAGAGDIGSALVAYAELIEVPNLYENYRYSCNLAAFSAFRHGRFGLAAQFYRKLSELIKEPPGDDLLLFATGASAYDSGDLDWGIIGLQKAALDRPGTEGGDRAELRLIDHALNTGGELELARAATEYGQLGRQAVARLVREEASFKRALALYLLADHRESVADLMRFRREFGSSKLRREADRLLLEQLPIVVHSLLEQQNELEAVVLVEQNRNLLLRGGFDRDFLFDLADSFDNLGLYARAGRVLLYLFDQAEEDALRKPLYLPLAKSYLKRNEYSQASRFASRYLDKYPQAEDAGALFGILLDAFAKQDRPEELLAWLERDNRPSSPQLEIRAAWIYWEQDELTKVVSRLEKAQQESGKLQVKEMALLAEAYYRLRQNKAAQKIYRQLQIEPTLAAQARYRSAQILLRQQERGNALNLLEQLVEEDGKSSWAKLAQDLLIQEKTRSY